MTDIGLYSGDLMVVDKAENPGMAISSLPRLRGVHG
jgi:hypothetical protein